jgi:K+-sensing histidine kinase KdpD
MADDHEACDLFEQALAIAKNLGVPLDLVYLPGGSIAERIAKTARDRKVSRVYAGLPSRKGIMRLFRGDVIGPLAELLPEKIELVVRG